jgi:catalase
MELNRYSDKLFAAVERAAFSPANVVPGIGFAPDKMLQGRRLSYGDTQRYRLGVNFNHIPVNAPHRPFHSYHRDGTMRTDGNLGAPPTYWPNSEGEWFDRDPGLAEPPLRLEGAGAHWDHHVDQDHYEQPAILFRKMTLAQQRILFENTVRAMGDARPEVKQRPIATCAKADPAYGAGIAAALGLTAVRDPSDSVH